MNNLHQAAHRRLSSASSVASRFSQQKAPAFAALLLLFPLAIVFSMAAMERVLLAVRHLLSV